MQPVPVRASGRVPALAERGRLLPRQRRARSAPVAVAAAERPPAAAAGPALGPSAGGRRGACFAAPRVRAPGRSVPSSPAARPPPASVSRGRSCGFANASALGAGSAPGVAAAAAGGTTKGRRGGGVGIGSVRAGRRPKLGSSQSGSQDVMRSPMPVEQPASATLLASRTAARVAPRKASGWRNAWGAAARRPAQVSPGLRRRQNGSTRYSMRPEPPRSKQPVPRAQDPRSQCCGPRALRTSRSGPVLRGCPCVLGEKK